VNHSAYTTKKLIIVVKTSVHAVSHCAITF